MTMWEQRAGIWLACAAVVVVIGGALIRVPATRAQAAALAQSAPVDSGVQMRTQAPVVRPEDVPHLPAKGGADAAGAAGGRPGRGGGRKAKMLGHLMTLLTLGAAVGAGYAYQQIRRLRDAHARLQDTIAGQARQLAEIKATLDRSQGN